MTSETMCLMSDITRSDGSKSPCVVPSILPGRGNKYGGAHSFSLSAGRLACKHVGGGAVKVGRSTWCGPQHQTDKQRRPVPGSVCVNTAAISISWFLIGHQASADKLFTRCLGELTGTQPPPDQKTASSPAGLSDRPSLRCQISRPMACLMRPVDHS